MSKIAWTNKTWNPIIGCSKISIGCTNCYAERMANRLAGMEMARCRNEVGDKYAYVVNKQGKWKNRVFCDDKALDIPLHWKKPRMIFVCSMSDIFHPTVPFEFIDKIMAVIALCPQHTFQCLSKRPKIMQNYFKKALPRISALVYNVKYGQGKDIFGYDSGRRTGNRPTGQDMATQKTPREGSCFRRRVSDRNKDQSMQESSGGISTTSRVSIDNNNGCGQENDDRGTQSSLGISQSANPKGPNHQPREWKKRRQLSEEFNFDDIQPTKISCAGGVKSESAQAAREQTPKDVFDGKASSRNSQASQDGNDGKNDSNQIQNESKSNISDNHTQDMETHLSWPLPNLWLGVTAENQEMADKRIPILLQTPAAVHFVSNEPLLGEIVYTDEDLKRLDWIIVGAESGPGARLCKNEWVKDIVKQCKTAGVKCFVKQIHKLEYQKKTKTIKHKLIKEPAGWPREYPKGE